MAQRDMGTSYAPLRTWVPVASSNVAAIWYDVETEILKVRFHNKRRGVVVGSREYAYSGVPLQTYLGMLRAASKGKFVWRQVRDQFVYTEL